MSTVSRSFSREDVVRRLLGVATQLFLDDLDPVSTHCLVSSAAENASLLAKEANGSNFNDHIRATFPEKPLKDIQKLRNQYWTKIKHSKDTKGNTFSFPDTLEGFADEINDHTLFVVWYDYSHAGLPLPLEVQAFQVWYYGLYPDKLLHDEVLRRSQSLFGSLAGISRVEQKRRLKSVISKYRSESEICLNEKTDPRPLVLP